MRFYPVAGHTIDTSRLPTAPFVIDAGANLGLFSRTMMDMFRAECVLIEANPDLASRLSSGGMKTLPYAVMAEDGPAHINIAANHEGSSVLALPAASNYGCSFVRTTPVEGKSLRSIVRELDTDVIDVLKLDIEGAETEVLLKASAETLSRFKQITIEFHGDPSFGFAGEDSRTVEVLARLRDVGFLVLDFSPSHQRWVDVLCINKKQHQLGPLEIAVASLGSKACQLIKGMRRGLTTNVMPPRIPLYRHPPIADYSVTPAACSV